MNDKGKITIRNTVNEMLEDSCSKRNIQDMTKKHAEKVHFIPVKYRVIGGILQGLNIKFGNFIEKLLINLVEIDENVNVLPDAGKKTRLFFTAQTDNIVDAYITSRQLANSPDDCTPFFDKLLQNILEIEGKAKDADRQGIVKDIDGLFITKKGLKVYTEIKYNDDHDTDLGVRTKNSKYGKTFLLNIPELLEVIISWDHEIKRILTEDGFWFAPLSPDTKEIDPYSSAIGEHRETIASRNLKDWLKKVELEYHSPHKFRHGHIQYGMQNAKTIADYKAVSMNVMHSSMDITDEVYSQLGDDEIRNRIGGLNQIDINSTKNKEDAFLLFQEFLAWRESKNK